MTTTMQHSTLTGMWAQHAGPVDRADRELGKTWAEDLSTPVEWCARISQPHRIEGARLARESGRDACVSYLKAQGYRFALPATFTPPTPATTTEPTPTPVRVSPFATEAERRREIARQVAELRNRPTEPRALYSTSELFEPRALEKVRAFIEADAGKEVAMLAYSADGQRISNVLWHNTGDGSHVNVYCGDMDSEQPAAVLHNHPVGSLDPSVDDLSIARTLAQAGVGFIILDADAGQCRVVCFGNELRANGDI